MKGEILVATALVCATFGCGKGYVCRIPTPESIVRYEGLEVPRCDVERPESGEKRHVFDRHACWRWSGSPDDRMVSGGCRINAAGAVSCWKQELSNSPTGRFRYVADDGYRACAIREDGRPVCWGPRSRFELPWARYPDDVRLRTVVVGAGAIFRDRGREGHRELACGLTEDDQLMCWESGEDGHIIRKPGRYRAVAAGHERVCAVGDDRLVCWGWDNSSTEIRGEFEAVSVNDGGLEATCVIERKGEGRCWGNHIADDAAHAASLGLVVSVSAGYQHGCGLRASGEVVCVGAPRPPPALRLRQLSTATVDDTRCGITMDGATYCWGDHSTTLDLPEI